MIKRRLSKILAIAFFITLFTGSGIQSSVHAQYIPESQRCSTKGYFISTIPSTINKEDSQPLTIMISGLGPNVQYRVRATGIFGGTDYHIPLGDGTNSTYTLVINDNDLPYGSSLDFNLLGEEHGKSNDCFMGRASVRGVSLQGSCNISVTNTNPDKRNCGDLNSSFNVSVSGAIDSEGNPLTGDFELRGARNYVLGNIPLDINGNGSVTLNPNPDYNVGVHTQVTLTSGQIGSYQEHCKSREELVIIANADRCEEHLASTMIPGTFNLCHTAEVDNNGNNPCADCFANKGIWTAVGCLPTEPEDIIPQLVRFFIGFAGGIALLLMLIGAFRLSVSAGNPDALKAAKEMITNAIAGLVIIIFSAVLLQVIGVQILQVPGF